ncbi:TonB-dependent receptor [Methylocaldum marinum]|nr:TonB-dependent receptor [Methylocaldum marinum]
MGERLAGRLAGRFERFRNAAENEDRSGDLAVNIDLSLTPATRLRVDAEWRRADWSSGVGWPAFEDLPKRIDRTTSLTQPWARYRFDSLATLVALEHASSPETLWRAGVTRVRYRADWHDLYLDPTDGNAFTLIDFVYPDQAYRFDAWHADVTHRGWTGEVAHTLRAGFSRLRAEEPDQVRPGQVVGAWRQGAVLPSVDALPASAARELVSEEMRLTVSDTLRWEPWFGTLGVQYALFEDDNGSTQLETARWLPVLSVGRSLTDRLSVVATHSWGAYGRQFASLTSETPSLIQPATVSTETEIGVRWSGEQVRAGLALFEIARPYRFERQVVSVWRGEQRHRGIEATLQWQSEKTGTQVAATTQLLEASVTGTGEADLDGKQPPGVPSARATLYVEQRLGAESPWTLSVSAEGVSRRATFDDNAVFAPGYLRWDLGLQWTHRFDSVQSSVLFTVQNVTDAFAWSYVGGGLAYALPPRSFGITLSLER